MRVGNGALRLGCESQPFLNKGDAEHIRAEQQRETTNGKGEIDLIHGDLSETAPFRYSVPNLLSQNDD
jgi:hypothetical protein